MRKLHLLLLPALVLGLSLGLAACGGGGESDEDKIVETIETSATSTDPAICKETETLSFMEQILLTNLDSLNTRDGKIAARRKYACRIALSGQANRTYRSLQSDHRASRRSTLAGC